MHASAHAWVREIATDLTIEVVRAEVPFDDLDFVAESATGQLRAPVIWS